MTLILLTGAGFSRNWGGWTSGKVHTDIAMRISGDPYLRNLLQNHNNFESALEVVQNEHGTLRNHE
jgi:hypothetical protein